MLYRAILIALALVFSTALANLASAAKPTRGDLKASPVKIVIAADVLEKLTPAQREDVATVVAMMEKRLFTWTNIEIELPQSIFGDDAGQIVELSQLFRAPTGDEVSKIGMERLKLDASQLSQIQQEGIFVVPSREYPGQLHVWRFSAWFQTGRNNIEVAFETHKRDGLSHLIVKLPARIWGDKPISMRRGLRNFYNGLLETAGLFVGLTEHEHRYSEDEVVHLISKAHDEFQRNENKKAVDAGQGAVALDLRLYDDKLMAKAVEIVGVIERKFQEQWTANFELTKALVEKQIRDRGVPPEQQAQEIADELVRLEQEGLYSGIMASAELEALSPGLNRLIVSHGRALVLVQTEEAKIVAEQEALIAKITAEIRQTHPKKAELPEWLEAEVRRQYELRRGPLWDKYLGIATVLDRAGLAQDAELLRRDIKFYSEQEKTLRAELESQLVASRTFNYESRIWRKSKWLITRDKDGNFQLDRSKHYVVDTGSPGWRIANLMERTGTRMNNWLYGLIVSNLYNGPLGLRSLTGTSPFAPSWEVNRKTGALEPSGTRQTMVSRVNNLWESRRQILEEHRNSNNYGIFGKHLERVGLFFTADLVRGVIAPLLVVTGQPVLTGVNLATGTALSAASLVFAPLTSLFQWGFHAGIYDSDGTNYPRVRGIGRIIPGVNPRFIPLLSRLVGKAGIRGLGETVGSVAAIFWHPVAAAGHYTFGAIARSVRGALDTAFFQIIRKWGFVPGRESRFLIRRIKGPGLAANYLYQVSPEVVLVALRAELERIELKEYETDAKTLLEEAERNYNEVLDTFEPITGKGLRNSGKSPADIAVSGEIPEAEAKLDNAAKARAKLHDRLLTVPEKQNIMLSPDDYELTMQKATVLTRQFFERMFKDRNWSEAQIKTFWKSNNLLEGDWLGLARARLSAVFGATVAEPVSQVDKKFRIDVKAPGLDDYAKGLEDGMVPEEIASVKIDRPAEPKKEVKPRVPYVDGTASCERVLLGEVAIKASR